MIVLNSRPPNFDAIAAVFPIIGKPVLFAWAGFIYNPQGARVGPEKHVHEEVHSRRQGDDPAGWWARYIADPEFRLLEEIPAHYAEYRYLIDHSSGRAGRRKHLAVVAANLASPLYGRMIDIGLAKALLEGPAKASAETARKAAAPAPEA